MEKKLKIPLSRNNLVL